MHELLQALKDQGWKVRRSSRSRPLLPAAIAKRYDGLPSAVSDLRSSIKLCCSRDETAWFLTPEDYAGKSGTAFRWNEWEMMSLENAANDPEWQQDIKAFWDRHFPFMQCVAGDYEYLAVRLDDGAVVHGCGPEFEDATKIAESFEEFLTMFEEAVRGEASYPLFMFLGG